MAGKKRKKNKDLSRGQAVGVFALTAAVVGGATWMLLRRREDREEVQANPRAAHPRFLVEGHTDMGYAGRGMSHVGRRRHRRVPPRTHRAASGFRTSGVILDPWTGQPVS